MAKQVHKLTEADVQKAKPGAARYEKPDGGGLYLVVHPSGVKSWAVRYRRDGISRKFTVPGAYPAIDLVAARKAARAALRRVADGGDPASEKIEARNRASDRSTEFPAVVGEFLDKHLTRKKQRPRPRTLQQLAWVLGVEKQDGAWKPRKGGLAERWRSKKIADITKADVQAILDAELARGVPILANRMRAILKWLFSWCLRRDLVTKNPVAGIDAPAAEGTRERVLNDDELRLLWRACGEERRFGHLFRILALTGTRREEARGMTWGEVDSEESLWTIPAARVKNGREHVLPLSRLALEIITAQPRISGKPGYVFTTAGKCPLGGMSGVKARLDKRMLALAQQCKPKITVEPWTVHDLRRTVATGMARLGIPVATIEKVLNHQSGTFAGIVGTYQRHDFLPEMRAALDAWARHIEAIVSGTTANVIPIRMRGE